MTTAELCIAAADFERLQRHLHRPDLDEHAAIALAGVHHAGDRLRLLVRELRLLQTHEFPSGRHGYRQFAPAVTAELAGRAGDEGLAYVAIHSHPVSDRTTALSSDDLAGHRRIFPHLLDLTCSMPVAGVATGARSVAGEVWLRGQEPLELAQLRIIGPRLERLSSAPQDSTAVVPRFDRQARLFGSDGQRILREMRVGVVGVGGGGSIIVEQLVHLGVGSLVLVDFDRVEEHNLSRIVGARTKDARQRRLKVDVARRHALSIDPSLDIVAIDGDIADSSVAERLLDCDFLFLATDTNTSRLVFNAIVHRYLIPGIQIGAKVELAATDAVDNVYVAVRPVLPDAGCLYCQPGLIDPARLQQEARTPEEERAQNYLATPDVIDPSVITLNGIAASHAVNTMLLEATGLLDGPARHQLLFVREGRTLSIEPQRDSGCPFCGRHPDSTFARGGPASALPVRRGQAAASVRRRSLLDRLRDAVG